MPLVLGDTLATKAEIVLQTCFFFISFTLFKLKEVGGWGGGGGRRSHLLDT